MAADPNTGYDPDNDPELDAANARFKAAGDQYRAEQAQAAFTAAAPAAKDQPSGLQHWFQDLPQNIGSGLVTAAINTADTMHSGLRYLDQKADEAHAALYGDGENPDARNRAAQGESVDTPEYATVRNAVQNINQKYIAVQNPTLSDSITQGVAQFAIPFLGWSKAVSVVGGAGKLAAMGRTMLAESATAGTAMAPHDGRFADMLELGKHTEGKFADALNAITPDGSLLNNYLNYMTADKESEGEFEGRAKNIVDMVTGGAVISPLIHAGFGMLKGGMAGLKFAMENGVGSIDQLGQSPATQAGRIGYHGTPHTNFDTNVGFDDSKFLTGEGNMVFGQGHYLAESPDVAKTYQGSLAAKAAPEYLMDAQKAVAKAGGDKVKAYTQLQSQIANEPSPMARGKMMRMQQMIKNGAVDKGKGSFITADVADEHVNSMLDWDKPLSEQKLPDAVNSMLDEAKNSSTSKYGASVLGRADATGGDAYRALSSHLGGDAEASNFLDANGVPGNKFLDGNSRGGGKGTRNLVVFKGKNIKILKKE